MTSQLKKRNKIYLLTKNLSYKRKNKRKSKKFDHVKVESFFIKINKRSINYELDLLKDVKVHSVFHVSLLKSIDFSTFIQNTFHYKEQKKNEFEVKNILTRKDQKYLIK